MVAHLEATAPHLILVHGTWGRRSPWIRPDSLMSRTLESRFNVKLERFPWSGRNTHRARIKAAMKLASHIEQLAEKNLVIVAHSHGGNVALAAARIAAPSGQIRGIVALGTPFLTSSKQVRKLPSMAVTLLIGAVATWIFTLIGVTWSPILDVLVGLILFYLVVSLYSLLSLRRLANPAFEAMTGFRAEQLAAPAVAGPIGAPEARFEPAEPLTYRGHNIEFAPVSVEVIGFPSDEAGAALAAGQFLGLISGILARVMNALTRRASLSVWVIGSSLVLTLLAVLMFLVLAIPVLAWIDAGNLSDALDRLTGMRDAEWTLDQNPAFDLIDSVFPGWVERIREWLGGALPYLLRIARIVPVVLVAPLLFLAIVFSVLIIEAMTIGFDGAYFIWRRPITAVSAPIGTSKVSLLPVTLKGRGGLVHGNLTTNPWTVAAAADAVERLMDKPVATSGPF